MNDWRNTNADPGDERRRFQAATRAAVDSWMAQRRGFLREYPQGGVIPADRPRPYTLCTTEAMCNCGWRRSDDTSLYTDVATTCAHAMLSRGEVKIDGPVRDARLESAC